MRRGGGRKWGAGQTAPAGAGQREGKRSGTGLGPHRAEWPQKIQAEPVGRGNVAGVRGRGRGHLSWVRVSMTCWRVELKRESSGSSWICFWTGDHGGVDEGTGHCRPPGLRPRLLTGSRPCSPSAWAASTACLASSGGSQLTAQALSRALSSRPPKT